MNIEAKEYRTDCPIHREEELWSHSMYYDEKCGQCKHIVQIGKRKFCGLCAGRCTLHQVIRGQIGCTFCGDYAKKLDSAVCMKCLEDHPDAKPFEMGKILGIEEKLLKEWLARRKAIENEADGKTFTEVL